MKPLFITAYSTVNALGHGVNATLDALRQQRSGLSQSQFDDADLATWLGLVEGLDDDALENEFAAYDCRNNRLARSALQQDGFDSHVANAREHYGAARIGVFIGTSTSGILTTEQAYRRLDGQNQFTDSFSYGKTQDVFAATDFCRRCLELEGPALGISTACSSGAKSFASAYRHIQAGLCDAAVVGGVDSLCLTTLYGFNSLQLLSEQPCRPWDSRRDGLSLGEAAAFFLLEREPINNTHTLKLSGYGESSDAYHMSSGDPDGIAAGHAIEQALTRAQLAPEQIDYINLHGTATPANDSAEDNVITRLFGTQTPCSSSKGYSGHTLGAAGALEALIACLCIEHSLMPASLNTEQLDADLSAQVLLETHYQPVTNVLSNSFGFGGTNCSLIISGDTP